MIRNFGDHAANERTFLAWVRTAVAVMAFGFVIEKFNIFLQVTHLSLPAGARSASPHWGQIAGLALMMLGLAIVAVATGRFLSTSKAIDDPETHPGPGSRIDVALAALLFLLGIALLAYLVSNLITGR